jgi:hypothetical protein
MRRILLIIGVIALSTSLDRQVFAQNSNGLSPQIMPSKQNSNNSSPVNSHPQLLQSSSASQQIAKHRMRVKNFVPQRQEFRQKMLQRFDANHNGKIDPSERQQMRAARRAHRTSVQSQKNQ